MDERKNIEKDEAYLRQVSEEVDFEKDNYLEWISVLKNYCEKNVVYALSPVQIGLPKRMIYIKNTSPDMSKNRDENYDEGIVFINPRIIREEGKTVFLEGCLSCTVGEEYLVGEVERPYLIEVEYFDLNGICQYEIFEGFKTTVFCHEYDHLNGVLHIDKSNNIKRMKLEEMQKYRKAHPYEIKGR